MVSYILTWVWGSVFVVCLLVCAIVSRNLSQVPWFCLPYVLVALLVAMLCSRAADRLSATGATWRTRALGIALLPLSWIGLWVFLMLLARLLARWDLPDVCHLPPGQYTVLRMDYSADIPFFSGWDYAAHVRSEDGEPLELGPPWHPAGGWQNANITARDFSSGFGYDFRPAGDVWVFQNEDGTISGTLYPSEVPGEFFVFVCSP